MQTITASSLNAAQYFGERRYEQGAMCGEEDEGEEEPWLAAEAVTTSSLLQAAGGTVIMLDEWSLRWNEQGTLAVSAQGIQNIRGLRAVAQCQSVMMKCSDYTNAIMIPLRSPVLVLSQEPSSLVFGRGPPDLDPPAIGPSGLALARGIPTLLTVRSTALREHVEREDEAALLALGIAYRTRIASLLQGIQRIDMTHETTEAVETAFCKYTQTLDGEYSAEGEQSELTLHRWLNTARAVAISMGSSTVRLEHWEHAMQLEQQRRKLLV